MCPRMSYGKTGIVILEEQNKDCQMCSKEAGVLQHGT